eukprot:TRINITY_DN9106_c0_g1_i1.p1 TRINITY_DN9106_c0_g1~~TRINITY_DN9106_c0_g1_i1.p1  ORF type:complete len:789 (-),score=217.90 TRINITY_DN9106_c0_g1_i1:189-2555(-)
MPVLSRLSTTVFALAAAADAANLRMQSLQHTIVQHKAKDSTVALHAQQKPTTIIEGPAPAAAPTGAPGALTSGEFVSGEAPVGMEVDVPVPGSGGFSQAEVEALRQAAMPGNGTTDMDDVGDDGLLEEPMITENPHEAMADPELVQAAPANFPEPLAKGSKQWLQAEQYAFKMLSIINSVRNETQESWIDPSTFKLVRAWAAVEDGEAYKLCTEMHINSEKTWALIDATTTNNEAELTSVTPAFGVLGKKAFDKATSELSDGEQLEEDTTNMNEFPCNGDVALLMEAAERTGYKTGLLRSGSSAILGRRSKRNMTDFPAEYDSRAAFPECALAVQDQGGCGSCYAFAAASVAGERLCIHRQTTKQGAMLMAFERHFDRKLKEHAQHAMSVGNKKFLKSRLLSFRAEEAVENSTNGSIGGEVMSQQELVSCGSSDQPKYETPYCLLGPGNTKIKKWTNGCEGGTPLNSMYFIHLYGLPTKTCVPYVSGGGGDFSQHFDLQAGKVPLCSALEETPCHKERAQNRVGLPVRCANGDIACIMDAIYHKGPVFASISAESGLMHQYVPGNGVYADDVYVKHANETHMGMHAVVLHGWGTSASGIDYWIGRNSWGDSWGEGGLFKIRRGTNEVGVEDEIYFANADPMEPANVSGDCVKVQQVETTCILTNECEGETRKVKINYLGDSKADNCGSWTTSASIMPGAANAATLNNAHSCTVIEDVFESEYDNSRYWQDVTAQYVQYGYTCVLKNTFTGTPFRKICCGNTCAHGGPGLYAMSAQYCEAGCPTGVFEQ